MPPDSGNRDLTDLAADIADGGAPDWTSAASDAADEHTRLLIGKLQMIAGIARAHDPASDTNTSGGATGLSSELSHSRQVPATWGPLRIVEKVGSGRFGDVYRAFDPGLDRDVALKLLRHRASGSFSDRDTAEDQDDVFVIEEGRLAARVRHPNVVTIYGAQQIDGRTGIWMEFVEGPTLEVELAERGPFDARALAEVGVELSRALTAVHEAGMVHRDVKATNVMRRPPGQVVLGDFGTGRELDDPEVSRQGLAGTPAYLAPEIFARQRATPKSDIYSLGVLLFHLATRAFPVSGRTLAEIGQKHQSGERTSLRSLRPDLPVALTGAIDRALNPNPARRFENARAMEMALSAVITPSWIRPKLVVTAGLVLAAAIAVASAVLSQRGIGAGHPGSEASTGVVLQQIDPAFARRFNIRAPAGDSRHVTCTQWGRGNLAICDLADGTARELRAAEKTGVGPGTAIVSPDGRSIAYAWAEKTTWSLRIMGIDGSNEREVFRPGRPFTLLRWAADSRAAVVRTQDGPAVRFTLVPLSGAQPREIVQTEASGGDLSPDLARVVVAKQQAAGGNRDIVILDVASQQETVVAPHPGDDASPMWTPDARAVVFQSDRLGDRSVFVVSIRNGRPSEPRLVHQLGRYTVTPLGFSNDGVLFLELRPPWMETYVASIDFDRHEIGPPRRLNPRSLDETGGSDWSPDGRQVAFLAQAIGGLGQANARLVISNRETSAQREFPLAGQAARVGRTRYLLDGRRIAVGYWDGTKSVVDLIDTSSGAPRRILEGRDFRFDIPARRDAVFYQWAPPEGRPMIHRLDVRTMATTVVYDPKKLGPIFRPFAVSPNGHDLLVVGIDRGADKKPRPMLRIVRGDGSVIDRLPIDRDCAFALAWSPSGSHIAATCMESPDRPVVLWMLPAYSGEATELKIDTPMITDLSIRPDGREITFTAGNPPPEFYTIRGIRWD